MANNYDVIIVGSGVAGLYAAVNLPKDLRILLISKKQLSLCNSSLAQGGIAGVYDSIDDSVKLHENDSLVAGGFKNNPETLGMLVNEAAIDLKKIIELGVEFDKNSDGSYNRTLEGGHTRRRIFHHEDATGAEITNKLLIAVQALDNVDIYDNAIMCQSKKTSTGFSINVLRNNIYTTYNCHFLIFATGGIGRVYEYTTNSSIATGDGITLAYEMGAEITNLSLVQFHPTAFNNHHTRECFLVSEAVRGEGAYLLNANKERFMHNYDERLELAPRDVVSDSIIKESKRQDSKEFYLDISYKDSEFLKKRFPMIYQNLLEHGYDLTKDIIPIYPCQHYLMGGINVTPNAATSIENLYAAGECAHTGVHGNNRLASNSLLEALVFSRHAAEDITKKIDTCTKEYEDYNFDIPETNETIPQGIRTSIRNIMQNSYFVSPDKKLIVEGFERIKEYRNILVNGNFKLDTDYVEAKSLATVAYLILKEVI